MLAGYQNNEFGLTGSNDAVAVLNTMNGLFGTKMNIFEKRRKEDRERKLEELYDDDIDFYDRRRLRRNNNSNVCFISIFISIFTFRNCAFSCSKYFGKCARMFSFWIGRVYMLRGTQFLHVFITFLFRSV